MGRVFDRFERHGPHAHLDEVVVELLAVAQLNGDTIDEPEQHERADPASRQGAARHLKTCEACRLRVAARQQSLVALRHEVAAVAEISTLSVDLEAQRQSILSRLSREHGNGRVLAFPVRPAGANRRTRPAMRWLAAAAAAGLFAGLGLGSALGPLASRSHPFRPLSPVPASRSAGSIGLQPAYLTDELFLAELETALDNRHVSELSALDRLTPRAGDGTRAAPGPGEGPARAR
jgi:hypothetical protein